MIRCAAIDDEPLALKQMAGYISQTPFLELVASCSSAFQAMEILPIEKVNLIIADIEMPDLSGMDFIRSLDPPIPVIFTTAYRHYALEGFSVNALDYLLKPIDYPAFLKAATKARQILEHPNHPDQFSSNSGFLYIRSEHKLIRINHREILFIEGMSEYVRIHLTEGKPVMSLLSMKNLESTLPQQMFMRVHRSYIVNLEKIRVVERNRIVFNDSVYIPISEQYRETFQRYVEQNFL